MAESRALVVPRTVAELRDLVVRIGRGEADVSLGGKALTVMARLVERPEDVALRSITELATNLGVNASTLSRLARTLGYAGFSDFQRVFRDSLTRAAHSNFYSQQGHRLLDAPVPGDDDFGVLLRLARESIDNVNGLLSHVTAKELRDAATLLAAAPRVRVYGVRQMHAVASSLCYGLGMIRGDVSPLDVPGLGIAETLAQLHEGDALVVSSISPYSRRAVEVSRVANAEGIAVLAITDTRASPLAAQARHAFFIPHESSYISNSIGAYVVFCEGLVNLVAKKLGEKALKALERQEKFIDDLNIEIR